MTTFHDPPPQSRRAARQSERERASNEQSPEDGFTTFPQNHPAENRIDQAESPRSAALNSDDQPSTHQAPPPALPTPTLVSEHAPSARDDVLFENTLTRRELRELRARQEPEVAQYIEPPALIDPLSVVPEAHSVSAAREDAFNIFESLITNVDGSAKEFSGGSASRSPLAAPSNEVGVTTSSDELNSRYANAPAQSERVTALQAEGSKEALQTNLSDARAEFDELSRKRLEGQLSPAPEFTIDPSAVRLPSTGHWSQQTGLDDDLSDAVVTRTVGSGISITSALVLPAIPFVHDIRGPLDASGETMLTGSIDLPRTLSASGVSDRFDHADIDSLLDLNDSDIVSTDSAPVRAIHAVSTFSSQAVTQTQKPKGTRALTVLMISAVSMAVVVAGLVVAAFAFNML
jgi:hypothetical protein